jgi:hypothetical protein
MAPVTGRRTQKINLKAESVYGVLETAIFVKLNALRATVHPLKDLEVWAAQGDALPSISTNNDNSTELTMSGKMSFSDIPYVLTSLFGKTTPTLLGGVAYQWVNSWDGTAVVDPQSYSVVYGDSSRARSIAGVIFNTLGFSIARDGSLEMSSDAFGKAMTTGVVAYPRGSVYTLTITATGGTYTLTFGGQTTSALAFNLNAAGILAALDALSNIVGTTDVLVTGTGPWTITFTTTGAFGASDIVGTINTASLTGGSGTLVKTQIGGSLTSVPAVPMFPLMFDVYMDNSWATLGNTKIGNIYKLDLAFGERWTRVRPINSVMDTDNIAEAEGDTSGQTHTLGFDIAADATGEALLADVDAGTMKFFRIVANGAANSIDAGHAYLFQMDFAFLFNDVGEYGSAQGGVHVLHLDGQIAKDQLTGNGVKFTTNNKVATL